MKKLLCTLLALGMTFAVACGGNGGNTDNSSSSSAPTQSSESSSESSSELEESASESLEESEEVSEEDSWEEFIPDYTSTNDLVEYFNAKVGTVTYNTGKDVMVESLTIDAPIYLGAACDDNVFTVDGGADFNRYLTILGSGGGVVQANGGVLVLRNLTIKNDTHGFDSNYYRSYYAEFGGKVRFENCIIDCSIQLRNDAEAEFIDCEIRSIANDQYSVWVADGSAKFENCTFTGYRAIKVHEISGMDVVNVEVNDCVFRNISLKPAIAIDIAQEMSTTSIAFTGCEIYNCAPWTQDSHEGYDGFYESDNDTTTFTFTATDCYLDYELFEFSDGEIFFPDWE